MEGYSYSYAESSPRSRDIDFDNPPPWEDQHQLQQQPSPNDYKVKFICSYGGKIHPRPHDNHLSYIRGETKILAVDRNLKLSALLSKLAGLCDAVDGVSFKYQLPGEDLDALISVTNDDDLEQMMQEYDRLFHASPKPARLRLFLFPLNPNPPAVVKPPPATQSFGSSEVKSEKDSFVDALNSGPIQTSLPPSTVAPPAGNVDFLFGLEKGMPPPPAAVVTKVRDQIVDSLVHEPETVIAAMDDRSIATDRIQKHIQDLQRLRITEEQGMYRRKSDENVNNGGFPGEYYAQKVPEKLPPATIAVTMPGSGPVPIGYWPETQIAGGVYQVTTLGSEQPVYVIPAHAGAYHAPPMGRPVTGPPPPGQVYYAAQRIPQPQEAHREQQQLYNVVPSPSPVAAPPAPAAAPPILHPQKVGAGYSEAMGYGQVAFDNGMARQVYYTAAGGVVAAQQAAQPAQSQPKYQGMAAVVSTADMRAASV